ncbi:MAG: 30S ribosomal protein S21 [bacterium]
MVTVRLNKGESIDRALRRFKQQCRRAGILKDYKQSRYFRKPSRKRKDAKMLAQRRQRRLNKRVGI